MRHPKTVILYPPLRLLFGRRACEEGAISDHGDWSLNNLLSLGYDLPRSRLNVGSPDPAKVR